MIAIVDYGLGNMRAFGNAYRQLNIPFVIARTPVDLSSASKIILPGVGSFDDAVRRLHDSGLGDLLVSMVSDRKVPVLGVCVGMQLLARSSEEGQLKGLGFVDGVVRKVSVSRLRRNPRLPHMGWNTVNQTQDNPLFRGLAPRSRFYFLHSYCFYPDRNDAVLATADYGESFVCAVHAANIYGVQFHPEKSHRNGMQLLRNFAEL